MGRVHADYIEREGRYSSKEDLQYSESGNMPKWAEHDASVFWHAADVYERSNGRPFRELEIALPRELNENQRIELVREFVQNTLGDRHAYTWAIHAPEASDGLEQPHAHIMFTERVNDGIERDPEHFFKRWNEKNPENGGAGKDRYLNSKQFVRDIREEWAMTANRFLEREGIEARIDHRSYVDQGIHLEPQLKMGISTYTTERGILKEITAENRERAFRNGERILENPDIAFKALTATQSVFNRRDVEQFVFRNTDNAEQYQAVYQTLMNSPELVKLQVTERQGDFYTSQELRAIEERLIERSARMGDNSKLSLNKEISSEVEEDKNFNSGQKEAYELMTSDRQLATVNGAAGTGKSYVLGASRETFEREGFRVMGAALQGKTADDMQRDAGIQSQTIHSLISQLEKEQVAFDKKTVLVIDEAGMVGSRQMEKLLDHAERSGATVRLVGDAWQLHAVDAGDAFRHVSKQTETAHLTEIMRQKQDWQRDASTDLSKHDISRGIGAYQERGYVKEFENQEEAREALLAQWQKDRDTTPDQSQIILAHTNIERTALNSSVRDIKREAGELGKDHQIKTEKGSITLAEGDRIMFTQNEYVMQVKNGTMGQVEKIDGDKLGVRLDDGRKLDVNTKHYGHFDHGYAVTIHKSQGVTVDKAYLLATKSMNAELAYVGMTRHKEDLHITYSREQFKDADELKKSLSRADNKTFSAQYAIDERVREREIGQRQTLAEKLQDKAPNELSFKERVAASAERTRELFQQARQQQKNPEDYEKAKENVKEKEPELQTSPDRFLEQFMQRMTESAERTREQFKEQREFKDRYETKQEAEKKDTSLTLAEKFQLQMKEAAERTREKIQEQRQENAKLREEKRINEHPLSKEQKFLLDVMKQAMQKKGIDEKQQNAVVFEAKTKFYNNEKPINDYAQKLYDYAKQVQEKEHQREHERTRTRDRGMER